MATRDTINEDPGTGVNTKPIATLKLADLSHAQATVEDNAVMLIDGVAVTPKFAKIAAAGSGDNTLVAGVIGKKIRVLSLDMMSAGTVSAKFQSGAGGGAVDLTGLYPLAVNSGKVNNFNPAGWFETAVDQLLNLNLSGAVGVGGCLTFIEI